MAEKIDLVYDAVVDLKEYCKDEFKQVKENAKAHATEMHEHKKEMHEKMEAQEERLDKLEAPRKALNLIKSWALWIIAIGGALSWLKDHI